MKLGRCAVLVAVASSIAAPIGWAAATVPSNAFAKLEKSGTCSAATYANIPSPYYGIQLVSTKRVPGTARSKGVGKVQYRPSPFGVSIDPKGNYTYEVSVSAENLKPPRKGAYVAWLTSSDLSEIHSLGVLTDSPVSGAVSWNKFLVVVTLEPDPDAIGEVWTGPIVLRGMSRSGLMHTLAGHGPFESEPCSKYGYD